MTTPAGKAEANQQLASTISWHTVPYTVSQKLRRSVAVANSALGRRLVAATYRSQGRRRTYPVHAVLAALVFHTLSTPDRFTLTDVNAGLKTLSRSERLQLGFPIKTDITYRRLYSGYRAIVREIETGAFSQHTHDVIADPRTGEVAPCPEGCTYIADNLDSLISFLVLAGIPESVPLPSTAAVDSTDFEIHAHPHVPMIDSAGRTYWSPDHSAGWGHRTATDRRQITRFLGYSVHMIVGAPPVGGDPIPQLCLGIALRPGSRDVPSAAINLLDALSSTRQRITEVIVDRGYSTAKPERFARKLRQRGISVVMDLHASQRGTRPGPVAGTIWQDGHLASNSLPQTQRDLVAPDPRDSSGDVSRSRELFDARRCHFFVAHSRHDDRRGTQRLKGPALAGHVRCPNNPASMRRGPEIPTTNCTPDVPCGCGLTVTVADTDLERDRQRHLWQTSEWGRSYDRRTLVEGLFGNVRYNASNINRGYLRIRRFFGTAFLLALAMLGYYAKRLHQWHLERDRPDPWQIELDEEPEAITPDPIYRTRGP